MADFFVRRTGRGSLRLSGDIDASAASQLKVALAKEALVASTLVVDVSRVSFIDSVGLRVLLQAARRLEGELLLVRPSPVVERIFALRGASGHRGIRIAHGPAA